MASVSWGGWEGGKVLFEVPGVVQIQRLEGDPLIWFVWGCLWLQGMWIFVGLGVRAMYADMHVGNPPKTTTTTDTFFHLHAS